MSLTKEQKREYDRRRYLEQNLREKRKKEYPLKKESMNRQRRKVYPKKKDKIIQHTRKYYSLNSDKVTKKIRHYQKIHPEVGRKAVKKWVGINPEKVKAQQMIRQEIFKGRMFPVKSLMCKKCEVKTAQHYHHPDYSKPLEVIPLCAKCHRREHNVK